MVAVLALVVLSGCSVADKSGNYLPIDPKGGIWDFIVYLVSWVLNLFANWLNSYAAGILITTIIVRTILFPVYTKSNDTSTKMQEIQPQLQKVQAKYAGKTDPESRQKLQFEMMQVYKENDVHMLAGCLMPLLQMPVFWAMYHAVARTPITYNYGQKQMKFLWTYLDAKAMGGEEGFFAQFTAHPELWILPVLVLATTIFQQWTTMRGVSPEARNNPTMKMMMYMMPIMMFTISLTSVQALSLYWVIGNIYSTLQYIFVKKPFKKAVR